MLTLGSGESSAFLAVIVNRNEAFFGAPEPRADEAEGEGDGAGEEADAFAAAAAAASLSSRGPARTSGEQKSSKRESESAARGALSRRARPRRGV
jgi:hypothetical protein